MTRSRAWSSARVASRWWLAAVRGAAGRLPVGAVLLALLLGGAGCLASDPTDADVSAHESTEVPAVAAEHEAIRTPAVAARSAPEVAALLRTAFTVEELLQDGLQMAGASPVHLAIRGPNVSLAPAVPRHLPAARSTGRLTRQNGQPTQVNRGLGLRGQNWRPPCRRLGGPLHAMQAAVTSTSASTQRPTAASP